MSIDPLLKALIEIAEKGAQFGITIAFPGGVVSGTLVDAKTFWRKLSAHLKSQAIGNQDFVKLFTEAIDTTLSSLSSQTASTEFLHIIDAQLHSPAGEMINLHFWRAPLSAISGFALAKPLNLDE